MIHFINPNENYLECGGAVTSLHVQNIETFWQSDLERQGTIPVFCVSLEEIIKKNGHINQGQGLRLLENKYKKTSDKVRYGNISVWWQFVWIEIIGMECFINYLQIRLSSSR